jgi:hypothetical protein
MLLSYCVASAVLLMSHSVNASPLSVSQSVVIEPLVTTQEFVEQSVANDNIRQAYFTPIATKQALVCHLSALAHCIGALPQSLQQQTAFSASNIRRALGGKSAMVLVAKNDLIAGVIIINSAKDMLEQTGAIGLTTYQLPLAKQAHYFTFIFDRISARVVSGFVFAMADFAALSAARFGVATVASA